MIGSLLMTLSAGLVLALVCFSQPLAAAEFKLHPRLCLHDPQQYPQQHPQQPCELQVKVSWQQQVPACLYQKSATEPLLCGNGAEQQLKLMLTSHTRLELRAQQSGALLDSRLVRVLQVDLNAGDQLLKRSRASWGTP
ncbi:DUF3019 domain-containing protein [Rheinheimera sp. 4Y26]|uniref:DUF3019 domain-containing protein n=1 Tax=Rheinheimera sp. 4Y26 TaxID=2977811 RepID=UPI0021B14AD8|nr:DUF3019 domain-containing protein [Rheinheimera sp. 4Y26]MCT6700386.1 DUF3019 domain-containing protein [Rheinheimera sp. 4Y26]